MKKRPIQNAAADAAVSPPYTRTVDGQPLPYRVALYARVSTRDRQQVENQLEQMRDYFLSLNWPIVVEYVDRMSGATADRPQLQQMLRDARNRKFDLLAFWSIDRLTREGVWQALDYLRRLDRYGIRARSHTEEFIDSVGPFKDVVIAIFACAAKLERQRMIDRINAGIERARKEGKQLGRPRRIANAEKLLELQQNGASLAEIARRSQLSRSTVKRRLRQARGPAAL